MYKIKRIKNIDTDNMYEEFERFLLTHKDIELFDIERHYSHNGLLLSLTIIYKVANNE